MTKELFRKLEDLEEDIDYYQDQLDEIMKEMTKHDVGSEDHNKLTQEYVKTHAELAWTREKIEGVERQIEDELEYSDEEICQACSGSGEGMYDGTTCSSCKGSGVATGVAYTDDDYDELTVYED